MAGQGRQRQPGIARLKSEKTPGAVPPGVFAVFTLMVDLLTVVSLDFRLVEL